MEDKTTILRKAEGSMAMPSKIKIGDPMYFEEGEGLKHTYSKSFRGKSDWVCSLEITESNIEFKLDETSKETMEMKDLCFNIYLAYDEKMLSLIKEGKVYTRQKTKTIELGVDSASYILDINNSEILIRTDGDGSIGYVCEYYTGTKLEAVAIEVTLPCDTDEHFNSNKKLLESLFKCTLNEIAI